MKKNIIFTFLLLLFLSLLALPKKVSAQYDCSVCNGLVGNSRPAYCDTYCNVDHPTLRPAQPTDTTENVTGKITNPIFSDKLKTMPGDVFLKNFIKTGISLVFLVGAVIFFFMLTSGGIKWLSSSGDKTRLESAQKQITSALVGLAILLTTFAIIQLIETLFGVSLLNITLPTL